MLKTQVAKITLHRGSGRRIKRHTSYLPKLNRETLFYAIAYGLFAELVVFKIGGKRCDWMSCVGQKAAEMLLTKSQDEIKSWLFDNVLADNLDGN